MESTPSSHLTRSSFAAMAGVLLSRASGVVRTLIVNATFGATTTLDAFNAAFRFPNSLRDLFADGALSSAFVTVLVPAHEESIAAERKLIAIILGVFITITFLLATLGAFYSEPLMRLIADQKFIQSGGLSLATLLFQILIFYLPMTMLNAVVMGVLAVHGKTFRAMNGSIFLSVGMILGALLLAPMLEHQHLPGIIGLAIGAMLGVGLQLFYQMQPLFSLKVLTWPNFNPIAWYSFQPLRQVLILMLPRTLGQGAMVIALAVNTYFALQLGAGVLTYIATAITIIQVPIGLFGVATGFAALPVLTRAFTKSTSEYSTLLVESLRTAQWLAALTSFGFCLLIVPFYVVLFQHGKIHFNDTLNNCIAVCAYSSGIIFAAGAKVLTTALYSVNATRQIIYNSVGYLVVNVALTSLLAPRLGILGLGISFGISTGIDFWLSYFYLIKCCKKLGVVGGPFAAGGEGFLQKTFFLSLLSFVFSLSGVWLIHHFWAKFDSLVGKPLTALLAALIFVITSGLILYAFIVLVRKVGPPHLQVLLNHRRIKRFLP